MIRGTDANGRDQGGPECQAAGRHTVRISAIERQSDNVEHIHDEPGEYSLHVNDGTTALTLDRLAVNTTTSNFLATASKNWSQPGRFMTYLNVGTRR